MTGSDNHFSPPNPGPMIFLTASVIGAATSFAVSTFWLALGPGWLSMTVGAGLSALGVTTSETIVDAIVFSLFFGIIMTIFVTIIPAPAMVKAGFVPAACGLCAGKLTASIWQESR